MTLRIMNGLFFYLSCNESFPSCAPPITSTWTHFLLFRINFLKEQLAVSRGWEGKEGSSIMKSMEEHNFTELKTACSLSVPLFTALR